MTKKKCCKRCKMFIEGNECPVCKDAKFSTNWQGRIFIMDTERSAVAQKIGITLKGEYALKCR